MHYPLASTTWDEAEYAAMQRVIASGMFTMGREVAAFEKDFALWVGSKYAVMVNSGSSANLAMIGALMFKKKAALNAGDEVIVPAVSWSTTYYPLQQYGLKLKFVDIDVNTLNMDLDQLENAISDKTKAILTVNLLGNPNDFVRITNIVRGRDIIILEDNCESMGAMLAGKHAGTFGLMGTFSSFFSHHISTMEGGFVVTDDEELFHILLCLRAHGWTRNLPKINHVCGEKSDNPFEESFRFVLPGYNLRPLELSGAIGQEQLKKLPAMIEARRKNAEIFKEKISAFPWHRIQQEIGESSWFGFAMTLTEDAPVRRDHLVDVLSSNGVEVRPIVGGNFAKNEVMKWFDCEIFGELPAATLIDKNGFFVGNHHYNLGAQIDLLAHAIKISRQK